MMTSVGEFQHNPTIPTYSNHVLNFTLKSMIHRLNSAPEGSPSDRSSTFSMGLPNWMQPAVSSKGTWLSCLIQLLSENGKLWKTQSENIPKSYPLLLYILFQDAQLPILMACCAANVFCFVLIACSSLQAPQEKLNPVLGKPKGLRL